jgi:hypothetical protein
MDDTCQDSCNTRGDVCPDNQSQRDWCYLGIEVERSEAESIPLKNVMD